MKLQLLTTIALFLSSCIADPIVKFDKKRVIENLNLVENKRELNKRNGKGYVKLEPIVRRGNNYAGSEIGGEARLVEKRDSDGQALMVLENQQSFYSTNILIGSSQENVTVLVDTGSSDLWVVNSNNTYCSSNSNRRSKKHIDFSKIKNFNEDKEKSEVSSSTIPTTTIENHQKEQVKVLTSSVPNPNGKDWDLIFTTITYGGIGSNPTSSMNPALATIDCQVYGVFDPSDSDSFRSNGTSFSITYADNTFAQGTWGHDDVLIDGIDVESLSFAVADQTDSDMGVLGIGLPGLETTYSGSTSSSPYMYENLPIRMTSQGLINLPSYSVFLNSTDSSYASILFGAIDHSKYVGDLQVLPVINTLRSYGYSDPIRLEITLNSLSVGTDTEEAVFASGAAAALLDTGTTLTYIPDALLEFINDQLDLTYSNSLGYYTMSCSDGDDRFLTFNFGGISIDCPLSSFFINIYSGSGSVSSQCALGLLSSGDDSLTLGDSFLRNAYMVADLQNYQIALAQSNLDTSTNNDENIEVMSSGIPGVKTAQFYSSSYGAQSTMTKLSVDSDITSSSISRTSLAGGTAAAVSNGSNSGSSNGSGSSSNTRSGNAATTASNGSSRSSSSSSSSTRSSNAANSFKVVNNGNLYVSGYTASVLAFVVITTLSSILAL
ncbi:hypothetical protein BVG19_g293 [[Candida] boidinii]|nr:hypothetical protein BVG19_g293 [[Candida] boidinii]OWB53580.1 hydrolase activity protein [[Candida] boidinii]